MDFNKSWISSAYFRKWLKCKIEAELFHANGRTDVTKLALLNTMKLLSLTVKYIVLLIYQRKTKWIAKKKANIRF